MKHTTTASMTDGYENTGEIIQHPCKVILTDEQIHEYGKQYAKNEKVTLPEIKALHREAMEGVEARMRTAAETREYIMQQLADAPDEDGFVPDDTTPETARELARTLAEISGIEGEIALLKLKFKADTETVMLKNEILRLSIDLGYELRDVSCGWWVNWDTHMKRLVRIDTGEVVLQRTLTPEEMQEDMQFDSEEAA